MAAVAAAGHVEDGDIHAAVGGIDTVDENLQEADDLNCNGAATAEGRCASSVVNRQRDDGVAACNRLAAEAQWISSPGFDLKWVSGGIESVLHGGLVNEALRRSSSIARAATWVLVEVDGLAVRYAALIDRLIATPHSLLVAGISGAGWHGSRG